MQLIEKWPSHCALSPPRHSPSGHASCWLLPAYDQAEQGCSGCPFPGRCGTPLLGNFGLKTPPRPDQIFWELHCHVRLFPSDSSSFPPFFRVRPELHSELYSIFFTEISSNKYFSPLIPPVSDWMVWENVGPTNSLHCPLGKEGTILRGMGGTDNPCHNWVAELLKISPAVTWKTFLVEGTPGIWSKQLNKELEKYLQKIMELAGDCQLLIFTVALHREG